MKDLRIRLLGLAVVAVFAACGDDATSTSSAADGTMSASVGDTEQWAADKSVVAILIGGELTITGTQKNNRFMKLNVLGVTTGTATTAAPLHFSFSPNTLLLTGFAQYSETGSDNFSTTVTGGSGTVDITELTATRAVGTFQFVGVRAVITGGGPGEQDIFRRVSVGKFDVRLR